MANAVATFGKGRITLEILSFIVFILCSYQSAVYIDLGVNSAVSYIGMATLFGLYAVLSGFVFMFSVVVVSETGNITIAKESDEKTEFQRILDKNYQYWIDNKEEFLSKYCGKVLLINNQEVVAVLDTLPEAYTKGVTDYGLGYFLIQECIPDGYPRFHSVETYQLSSESESERPIPTPGLIITEGISPPVAPGK